MNNYFFIIFIIALFACKEAPNSLPGVESLQNLVPVNTPDPDSKPESESPRTQTEAEVFIDLVNAHRAAIGLRSLTLSDEMSGIAAGHSKNMAQGTVSFGHTGFSERCSLARTALGGGNWCGENVAWGQSTPQGVFNSWMNSSGHKANIESARATHMGLGKAASLTGRIYWTQLLLEH